MELTIRKSLKPFGISTLSGKTYLSIAWGYFRLGMMEAWAFRSYSVNMLLSYPIMIFANFYLFGSLYSDPSQIVAGFTKPEIVMYISVAWLMRSVFPHRSGRFMAQRIRSGEVAVDLMKPLPLIGSQLSRNLGFAAVTLITVSVPLALVLYIGSGHGLFSNLAALPVFLVSAFTGFLILFACNFLLAVLSFYMEYNANLLWLFDLLMQLAGGLSVPLSFFPDVFYRILMFLPFKDIYATPTQIYLGKFPASEVPAVIGHQLAWLVVVMIVALVVFRNGLKHLSINGG